VHACCQFAIAVPLDLVFIKMIAAAASRAWARAQKLNNNEHASYAAIPRQDVGRNSRLRGNDDGGGGQFPIPSTTALPRKPSYATQLHPRFTWVRTVDQNISRPKKFWVLNNVVTPV